MNELIRTADERERVRLFFPDTLPEHLNKWFSHHLATMEEPILYKQPKAEDAETYRFLWLRSNHEPIAVRLNRNAGANTLFVKKLSGTGGASPGSLKLKKKRSLPDSAWNDLLARLEQASFWSLPILDSAKGKDGSYWVLEGTKEPSYRVISRWSPKQGKYRDLCLYFLTISDMRKQVVY